MQIVIRAGVADDAPVLAAIAERTFRDTFSADNKPADMEVYCASAYAPEIQRRELIDALVRTLVAVDAEGELVAYAQLRDANPPCGPVAPPALELWRFYVDRSHHGTGLAQRLMEAVMAEARARRAASLWLGVWERNLRAQAFYRKAAFVDIGAQQFRVGSDVQTDRVMARPVNR